MTELRATVLQGVRPRGATVIRHSLLVRITHWINAVSFLFLVPSGIAILIAHPEFYWGETGYFGHPALFTLPIEPNFDHSGWGRGMHFFFAWVLVINGLVYLLSGLLSGHFRRKLLPSSEQLRPRHILHEIRAQRRLRLPKKDTAPRYNAVQKTSYLLVIFLLFPVLLLSGLTMSPALTAAIPELFTLFGGRQSARTMHFIVANLLLLFLLVHVVQVLRKGAVREVRAMITGKSTIGKGSR